MNDPDDLLTGTWIFDPELSVLSSPAPQNWVQYIRVSGQDISVCEEMTRSEGLPMVVSVQAKLDGRDYSLVGSPGADVIAYTRTDSLTLSGIAKKNGNVSLKETLIASVDGRTLTLKYEVFSPTRQVAHGTAVFQRSHL